MPRRVSLQGPLISALMTPNKAKIKEHFRIWVPDTRGEVTLEDWIGCREPGRNQEPRLPPVTGNVLLCNPGKSLISPFSLNRPPSPSPREKLYHDLPYHKLNPTLCHDEPKVL